MKHSLAWLALSVAFWTIATHVDITVLMLAASCFTMVSVAAVALTYLPSAFRAMRDKASSTETARIFYITVGIVLSYGFSFLNRAWNVLWIQSGQELTDIENALTAFFQFGIGLGAIYLLGSPGAFGRTRKRLWLSITALVAGSGMLTAVLLHSDIDTSEFLAAVRPYVSSASDTVPQMITPAGDSD